MKHLLVGLTLLGSFPLFAQTIEERVTLIGNYCFKDKKLNLGIYAVEKECKANLVEKEAFKLSGICRGIIKRKGKSSINYKISFSTKDGSGSLDYAAVTKDHSLWRVDDNELPEISFYQPSWSEKISRKYLIRNSHKNINVTRGNETVVNITTRDIDLLFIHGNWGVVDIDKETADIRIKQHDGSYKLLENAECDLFLLY